MKTFSTATGSGNNVSGGVWLPKGTTLKKMMLILNDNQKSIFLSARCTDVLSEYSDEKVLKSLIKLYDDLKN